MSVQALIEGFEQEARAGQQVIVGMEQYEQDAQLRQAVDQLIAAMPGDRTETTHGRLTAVKDPKKGRIVIEYAQPAGK